MNVVFFRYLLKNGDDLLINAQRLSEWTSRGPFLEEDLAITNVALDLFGQANAFLEYAGKIENNGRDQDKLAFFRNDKEFLNCRLVEISNGDYARTILRQAFMDSFRYFLYQKLSQLKDTTLAGIAAKGLKEVTYHRRHSHTWVVRFGNATEESMRRLKDALDFLWRYTGDIFYKEPEEKALEAEGKLICFDSVKTEWLQDIKELFQKSGLTIPENTYMLIGGRKGVHTESLSYILNEMQMLPRMYPDAKW